MGGGRQALARALELPRCEGAVASATAVLSSWFAVQLSPAGLNELVKFTGQLHASNKSSKPPLSSKPFRRFGSKHCAFSII